jgi:hypothetical protein
MVLDNELSLRQLYVPDMSGGFFEQLPRRRCTRAEATDSGTLADWWMPVQTESAGEEDRRTGEIALRQVIAARSRADDVLIDGDDGDAVSGYSDCTTSGLVCWVPWS